MERENGRLSVVLPAYNEEEMLPKTVSVLRETLEREQIPFELIFVDDGSKDATWEMIARACDEDSRVRGVRFSRNFGKEAAIMAGLAETKGDCAAVMDCDLQHPPAALVEMYRLWEDGAEVVEGVKRSRGRERITHRMAVGIFYWIMTKATGTDMSRASDFRLLDRKAVDSVLEMPERSSFFRAQSSWIGYKTRQVEFDVQEREAGTSKWGLRALIRYAVDNIVGYSAAPMHFVMGAGVAVFFFAVILGIQTLVRYFGGHAATGFTTVILLILLIGSVIMISLGVIGFYIARIYEEVKGRPRYIVAEMKQRANLRESEETARGERE